MIDPDEKQVDEFATGYVGAEVPVTAETEPDVAPGLAAVEEVAGVVPEGEAAPAAQVAEDVPKTKMEIDADEYARLIALPAAMERLQEDFSRKLDSAFGKIGSTEQMLRKIQEATPRGEVPTLTKEDLGAFGENYEYMSDDLLVALNGMLGKLKGTGPATAQANPDEIASLVQENLSKVLPNLRNEVREEVARDFEERAVLKKHPDAKKLFGTPALIEFANKLPEAERATVLNSWEAEVIVPFLDKFKASIAKPAANVTNIDRKAALKAIVNPTSASGTPKARTEDDEFEAGYRTGRTT